MTRIPFFGVAVHAAQKSDSPSKGPAPAPLKAGAVDFLSLISQAVRQGEVQEKQMPAPKMPATPSLPSAIDSDTADAPAMAMPMTTLPGQTKKGTPVDDSLTVAIMTMLAPAVLPAVDIRKPLPQREASIKIASKQDDPASQTETKTAAPAREPETKSEKAEAVAPDKESSGAAVAKAPPAEATAKADASGTNGTNAKLAEPPPTPQPGPLDPAAAPDGTVDALNKERMKFTAEKKEIAGRTTQKVPSVSVSRSPAAAAISVVAIAPASAASGPKNLATDTLPILDWPAKPSEWNVELAKGATTAWPVEHTAAQVEKVSQMINQQAMSIRQTGASTLAVSLRVDAHTELFLQLTKHNGQLQATLSYDQGAATGLDNHWGDLQESLARQNVQLLPREDKIPAATTTASSFDSSSSAFSNSPRQQRALPAEWPEAALVKTISTPATTKTRTVSRQGWESWA
ncbi:MAG TPA: hypothetical protein VFC44_02460 [Candidatus Saccharimonadales bacterium]|nr:hypothetical protein [Candidatus Saccharimonadales bacterium]